MELIRGAEIHFIFTIKQTQKRHGPRICGLLIISKKEKKLSSIEH
jgi:hypothetical protein